MASAVAKPSRSKAAAKPAPKAARLAPALVPLSLARDNRFTHLIESVEPTQTKDDVVLSAQNTQTFLELIDEFRHGDTLRRHGLIDAEKAAYSDDHRVVLIREDTLDVNHFAVYEVPVPPMFQQEPGTRRIRVALAFDPVVRHTRLDYAGLSMSFDLFRGAMAEEVFNACRKWAEAEGEPFRLIDSRRCKFKPSTRLRGYGTLQCGSFEAQRNWDKYGDSYYLAVRLEGGWASAITPQQRFAIAVQIQHETEIALYQQVQLRVQLPA